MLFRNVITFKPALRVDISWVELGIFFAMEIRNIEVNLA